MEWVDFSNLKIQPYFDAIEIITSCSVALSPIFLAADKSLIRAAKEEGLKAFDVEITDESEILRRLLAGEDD